MPRLSGSRRDFLKLLLSVPVERTVTKLERMLNGPMPDYMKEWQDSVNTPNEAAEKLAIRWKDRYYINDLKLYGKEDFIASPYLSLSRGGDCEDAVLAMAFGLENKGYYPLMLYFVTQDHNSDNNHTVFPYLEAIKGKICIGYASLTRYNEKWEDIGPHAEILMPSEGIDTFQGILDYYSAKHPLKIPYSHYILVYLPESIDWRYSEKEVGLTWSQVIGHNYQR